MQIIPMRDLKNTVEIERRCKESHEPVFVTKNGYGSLVVMDIDYYDETFRKIEEARMLNAAYKDYEEGKVRDGKTVMKEIREKYGL
ncbi:MAG: type II toxin-antitoxin system Phd/YefM family antitoxin [Anaerolineaceae bacterium]|nr:type II toxin-antitoxin system Phd/YefM family antitoxin [Anaerolineaceae bacterium]